MGVPSRRRRDVTDRAGGLRLFGRYALATALPIVLLGFGLGHMYQAQMDHRALEQAISEAEALVDAGIEPHLGGRDLTMPLLSAERTGLEATTTPLLDSGSVLRLRLRDSSGHVVFDAAHLARLPLSELKIDRSFIAAMPSTRQDKTIVRTVIELGHQLGLQVVAEGAETTTGSPRSRRSDATPCRASRSHHR